MTGDFLRKSIAVLVCLVAVLGVYFVYVDSRPCVHPIRYHLGSFDARFGIGKEKFIEYLQKSATIWNTESKKTLFEYSETEGIPISLMYDTRQEAVNLGDSIKDAQELYALHKKQIDMEQRSYEKQRDSYEEQVAYWNSQGGAPAGIYRTLETERVRLAANLVSLNKKIAALNEEARTTNAEVNVYNETAQKEFEAGLYRSVGGVASIELYEFTTTTQLVRLAAHEFGHALGLDHNDDKNSIMYPKNSGESLALSQKDFSDLAKLCRL